jgi:hypothetical protein|uniref:Uncharacterized protein n=1 Tax=viral metagenome TaxID=1070528 RepID=A0A6C0JTS0_9ZZZZ
MNDKNLDKHTDKNTSLFNINYKKFTGKVVNILSGNKIRVIINIDNNYLKFNVILNRTLDQNIIGSKNRLYNLITNDDEIENIYFILNNKNYLVNLSTYYFDKDGNIVADVYKNGTLLSDILINEKFLKSI